MRPCLCGGIPGTPPNLTRGLLDSLVLRVTFHVGVILQACAVPSEGKSETTSTACLFCVTPLMLFTKGAVTAHNLIVLC